MSTATLYGLYALLAAGAVGLCLAMPSTRGQSRRLRVAGHVLGAAALAGVAVCWTRWIGPAFVGRTFLVIFALIGVAAAVRVVTHPRPVYSAVYFVVVVLATSAMCILAAAEFLAAALVIVYGGAILVTYVFVIMLAQQAGAAPYDAQAREPMAAVLMGFLLAAGATQALAAGQQQLPNRPRRSPLHLVERIDRPAFESQAQVTLAAMSDSAAAGERHAVARRSDLGNTEAMGVELMGRFMVAVQVAGVLMLVAMVGAIAVARKRIDPQDWTPHEQEEADARQGEDLHRRGREALPF